MNKNRLLFKEAVENICAEADKAARLSTEVFSEAELKVIRRELARLMEIVDDKILPIYFNK